MKTNLVHFICIIALVSFWTPHSYARSSYFNNICIECHSSSPSTCAGCHAHGVYSNDLKDTINVTATTDKLTYEPGETITVSITGGYRSGWVRTILYDQNGNEVARSTGATGDGGGPQFPGPITLTSSAPSSQGTYTWSASWYGNAYQTGANSKTFVPDIFNPNHGEETVFTNSFDVVVQCDANAPVITPPANLTITLAAGNTGPLSISDPGIQNFLNGATATDAEDGNLPVSNNAPADFPIGTTPVTFFATDSCGNEASATASVTIEVADNNLPVVTAPAPIEITAPLCATSVSATDPAVAAFLSGATATDAENGDVTASITNDAPVDFPVSTVTMVTFTAFDSLGANGTATATISVNETPNTLPAVTAPTAITIMVSAGTDSIPVTDPAIVEFLNSAAAMDVEDGNVTASITNDAPADFPIGTTSVTFYVADSCGMSASAPSTVTIQEVGGNIAPILNVPDQITVEAQLCAVSVPAANPAIDTFLNGATAADAEDGDITASITNDAPAEFPIGTTPVTFSVTDSNGGATTGVASVIVVDTNNAPVVIGPAPLSITITAGTTSVSATDTAISAFLNGATATDVEDGDFPSSAITNNAPADFLTGVTTVTFSVTDSCGLAAIASSTVTITEDQSTEAPTDDEIGDRSSEEEDYDEIKDDKNEHHRENKRYKNWRYESENKYRNEEAQSSSKLRLLKEEEDE